MSRAAFIAMVALACSACGWDWDSVDPRRADGGGAEAGADVVANDTPTPPDDSATCGANGQRCCASGTECMDSLRCLFGRCRGCDMGETLCGFSCVNVQTDGNNCGRCGNDCRGGRSCVAGVCQ